MTEIAAHQGIDLLLGRGRLPDPVRGWVVTFPDSGLNAEMIEDADQETINHWEREQATKSKWPHFVKARPCWIHAGDMLFGSFAPRRHWTPR